MWFIFGLFVGAFIGFMIAAILCAAHREEEINVHSRRCAEPTTRQESD